MPPGTEAAHDGAPETRRPTLLHELRSRPPELCNRVSAQRGRILDRLRAGPATGAALTSECHCPSVTKRISELRRAGSDIRATWIDDFGPDGAVSRVCLYSLLEGNEGSQQLPLFNR